MDYILDLHSFGIVYDPLVHLKIMILHTGNIVLCIRFPCKAEVIIHGCRFAVPVRICAKFAIGFCFQIGQRRICCTLNNNSCLTVFYVVPDSKGSFLNGTVCICFPNNIPLIGLGVQHIHGTCVCIITVGSFTIPTYNDHIFLAYVSCINRILNIGKDTACSVGRNISRADLFSPVKDCLCIRSGVIYREIK